jgi:hypothetical protein
LCFDRYKIDNKKSFAEEIPPLLRIRRVHRTEGRLSIVPRPDDLVRRYLW